MPLGESARNPEGKMKKLPTAPEVLMKSLRDVFFMVILIYCISLIVISGKVLPCLTFFRSAREESPFLFFWRKIFAVGVYLFDGLMKTRPSGKAFVEEPLFHA